jgi:hypothetical protein
MLRDRLRQFILTELNVTAGAALTDDYPSARNRSDRFACHIRHR